MPRRLQLCGKLNEHIAFEMHNIRNDVLKVIDTDTTVDSLYAWSAYNTKTVGKILGEALVGLRNLVGLDNIHIIGTYFYFNVRN